MMSGRPSFSINSIIQSGAAHERMRGVGFKANWRKANCSTNDTNMIEMIEFSFFRCFSGVSGAARVIEFLIERRLKRLNIRGWQIAAYNWR